MPTVGTFYTHFFGFSSTTATPVTGFVAGYPSWQASVIAPSLFGMIGAWIDTKVAQFHWWQALYRRFQALGPEKQAVLYAVMDLMERPTYAVAGQAVRKTATTLGFNEPGAWIHLSRAIKASPGRAENQYRHLNACTILTDAAKQNVCSTMTNPDLHLTVELAYRDFAIRRQ